MKPKTFALLFVSLVGCPGLAAQAEPTGTVDGPKGSFSEEIFVESATIEVRVVDPLDDAIFGLGREDFVAEIGRREIPITAVDWVSSHDEDNYEIRAEPALAIGTELPELAVPGRSGRRIVLFVQADFNAVRIRGHLRVRHYVERDVLPALHPDDWVAVVTFDSHLRLWHDFTRDHDRIADVLHRAIRFGGDTMARPNRRGPSLLPSFDLEGARDVARPEEALEFLGNALLPISGRKEIVYVGWGLGQWDNRGVRMTLEFFDAVRALQAAGTPVFVLDVTDADGHDLEAGIKELAVNTGGIYLKTQNAKMAALATRRLNAVMRGYYLVSVDLTGAPAGRIDLSLRGLAGRVLYTPKSWVGDRR